MTCPSLHYVHINILFFRTPLALRKSRGRDFGQDYNNTGRLIFGIKEEILSLLRCSLTLENKEELSLGQNGGNFKRNMKR